MSSGLVMKQSIRSFFDNDGRAFPAKASHLFSCIPSNRRIMILHYLRPAVSTFIPRIYR
jgi:hypothetical protein